jgi:hypothetical protein
MTLVMDDLMDTTELWALHYMESTNFRRSDAAENKGMSSKISYFSGIWLSEDFHHK